MKKTLSDAKKFLNVMRLKYTFRFGERGLKGNLNESVAAHSWSMFVVADYLYEILCEKAPGKYNLDMKKVYDLIIYHDLIEAETGDEDVDPSNQDNHSIKHIKEQNALSIFMKKIPVEIHEKFKNSYDEYEKRESLESKFVKIIDILEAEFFIHEKGLYFKSWSRNFHENLRLKHFEDFPELKPLIQDMIDHADINYYR